MTLANALSFGVTGREKECYTADISSLTLGVPRLRLNILSVKDYISPLNIIQTLHPVPIVLSGHCIAFMHLYSPITILLYTVYSPIPYPPMPHPSIIFYPLKLHSPIPHSEISNEIGGTEIHSKLAPTLAAH